MKKQTSLITLSLLLATPAVAGGGGAPVAGGGAAAACRTIAQIVSTDPQFSTLFTAVQAAGVGEMLGGGQYTVFAPTNAAFAKVPSDQLATLLNDPDMLRGVLQYHVVAGKVTAKQVMSLKSVKTAQGSNLTISMMGSRAMVGGANVTRADVAACNGVIHVIDTVLMPPMMAAPAPAPAAAAPATPAPAPAATPAPAAAPAATTTTDTAATTTTDTAATTTTTTNTAAASFDIRNIPVLPLSGATVSGAAGTTTTTTDTSAAATTTTTDTAATTTTDATANTLYDVIVADDRFSTLRDLLSDAGLTETLTSGEFTIFAPTNEAFDAIPAEQLAALSENPELLRRVLSYHVVQGRVSAEQLAAGGVLKTAEGGALTPSGSGANQMVGTVAVGATVNTASNGTIYVINQVLLPPGVTLPSAR